MGNEKRCSGSCCVLSFLVGAVVGGGIALLSAPQSGKRTREHLRRMAVDTREKVEDYIDEMEDKAAEITEKAQGYYKEAKQTVESAVDSAKKTFQKAEG